MVRIDGAADWGRAGTDRPGGQVYATAFHDFRSGDGYYRKLRFFCIGGKLFPQHLLMSDRWNVHISARDAMMKDRPWMQDEEHRFLDDHAGMSHNALGKIAARVGLDFFIDGALLPDGRLLVFGPAPVCAFEARRTPTSPQNPAPRDRCVRAHDSGQGQERRGIAGPAHSPSLFMKLRSRETPPSKS
jgi:hypothetical protein